MTIHANTARIRESILEALAVSGELTTKGLRQRVWSRPSILTVTKNCRDLAREGHIERADSGRGWARWRLASRAD